MRSRYVILLLASLALSVPAAPGCFLASVRRDGARCSDDHTCPPGQQCSSDGQCLYPCPQPGCQDNECGCGGIDRSSPGAGWTCLDGLCHFKCGGETGMGQGVCEGYMACDNSRSICLPACTGPEQCASGSTCYVTGNNNGGDTPSNYCVGTGGTGDGGVGDGGVGDGGTKTPYQIDLFDTPSVPRGLAAGNLNSDSVLDLVAVTYGNGHAFILAGQDDGQFWQSQEHVLGANLIWVGLGRFDADERTDFVFLSEDSSMPDVRMGGGEGNMTYVPNQNPLPFEPTTGVIAHLRLGVPYDLVILSDKSSQLGVALADGTGHFMPGWSIDTIPQPKALVAADLDNDGLDEIVVVTQGDHGLHLFRPDAAGGLVAAEVLTPLEGMPHALAAGQLDGNTAGDLVIAMPPGVSGDAFKVLFNWPDIMTGAGIPNEGQQYETVFLGDFDGDGNIDVGTLNRLTSANAEVVTFRNTGNRQFESAQRYAIGGGSFGMAAMAITGRFNADECDDIAVALPDQNKIAVLVSNGCPPGK